MRLLYVALTRAKHRCTVYWGAAATRQVAMGYLLHQPPDSTDPELAWSRLKEDRFLEEDLASLARHPDIEVSRVNWNTPTTRRWQPPSQDIEALSTRACSRSLHDGWRRASFSSLVKGRAHGVALEQPPTPVDQPRACRLAEFPAGSHTGNLLHKIFELHDFQAKDELEPLTREQMKLFGFDEEEWAELLIQALAEMLETPLGDGFSLGDLPARRRLNELEFYLPLRGGFESDGGQITPELLAQAFAPERMDFSAHLQRLRFEPLKGFLHGFIDLVFLHQGRWYLADFKSNRLGPYYEDYGQERLLEAMLASDYFLQYHLYCVGLHRYLKKRLKDYSYERHFGGVYYLFLRGMKPSLGAEFGVFRDRPPATLIERLDRLFEGGAPC